MKKLSLILIMILTVLSAGIKGNVKAETQVAAPTVLAPGDIAIIGYNTSPDTDIVTILFLKDVTKDTVLNFTDRGWDRTKNPPRFGEIVTREGVTTWTVDKDYTLGKSTQVTLTKAGSAFNIRNSTNGDQIFIFQGTTSAPTFIYGVNVSWTVWQNTQEPNQARSGQPAQLVNYSFPCNYFNARYTGPTNFTSVAAAQAAFLISTNWAGHDRNTQNITYNDFSFVPTAVKLSKFTSENKGLQLPFEIALAVTVSAAGLVSLRKVFFKNSKRLEELPRPEQRV
jgi:hypothetical protein